MNRRQSSVAARVTALCLLLIARHAMAQDSARPAGVEQPKPDDEYAALLTRVQAGDAAVDVRAFRIAGVLRFPHQASVLEAGERHAFSKLMAAGDVTGALDAAKQALDRNYASPIAHFDAMTAYQALGKTDEASLHEKLLNSLLDSIRQSGDGKSAETAYFVVTIQEEYIFLARVLNLRRKSQALETIGKHAYDKLETIGATVNQTQEVWFNTDVDMGLYKAH